MASKPRARYTRLSPDDRRATLIEAALACIAQGGIAAFTVDRICVQAAVSRGLVTHHFGSMEALLVAVYRHIYEASAPATPPLTLDALLDHVFSPALFNRDTLNIWHTLWAEISNRPDLRAEHRAQYARYHAMVLHSLPAHPQSDATARSLICLIDGLSLQHCIDPDSLPPDAAKSACRAHVLSQVSA